tara:strand:- start:18962 stop:23377 length:4416 start_codon:yes stop_codon:yes gene_type:complete
MLFSFVQGNAQAPWTLDFDGKIKNETTGDKLDGTTITIKRNGSTWKTLTVDKSGKFSFSLEPDAEYTIIFSKPGFVSKKIYVNTKNVPPEEATYGFDFPMQMNLFEEIEGLDVSILNQPIAKISFDPNSGYFDFDPSYTKSIKKQIEEMKKQLEELNRQYTNAIKSADAKFAQKSWQEAMELYQKAASIKTKEQYPKDKIAEIKKILDEQKQQQEAEKQKRDKYNAIIADADSKFSAKDYENAKAKYNEALGIFPDEKYPKDKIAEIEKLIAAQKQKEEQYKSLIAEADSKFSSKDYEGAKAKYTEALGIKPNEQYPKDKISEIEKLLSELAAEKQKEEQYKALIAEADSKFSSKDYEGAKAKYTEALGIKPNEQYPKDKISEIEKLLSELAAEKQKEEQYKAIIAEADSKLSAKDYEGAKAKYTEALGIKPNEKYPKDKISEIEKLMSELAAEKQKEEQYKAIIAEADTKFSSKDYEGAKAKYTEALGIKPNEQYPKDKISEIEKLLSELAAEKQKEEQYKALIAEADSKLSAKDYEGAKSKYNAALSLKPNEQYPKDKIAEIEKLLAELAAKEASEKQKEEQYKALIAEADSKFSSKDYEGAKSKYNAALGLKPNEQYPKDKIAEIEKILAELADKEASEKQKEEQYKAIIAEADSKFSSKDYEGAKSKYNAAIGVKPNEQYPKDKIAEIEKILAELAAKEASEKQKEEQYKALIAEADSKLSAKDYEGAKSKYNAALGVKPNEQYPKDKISEIEKILAELSAKEEEDKLAAEAERKKREYYNALIKKADDSFNKQDWDDAISNYQQASFMYPNEQYPKDKIAEIERLKKELADKQNAAQQKEAQYKALIAEADSKFSSKDYQGAKSKYQEALGIKPNEQYPKNKIAEIEKLLAELAAQQNQPKEEPKEKPKEIAVTVDNTDKQYQDLIASADNLFSNKEYIKAKSTYQKAQNLKPSEEYPADKIAEIDNILAKLQAEEQQKYLAEKAKKDKYNKLLKEGQKQFILKNYQQAINAYESALAIYPDEKYPKGRIEEIKRLMEELANKQKTVTNNQPANNGGWSTVDDTKEKEILAMVKKEREERERQKYERLKAEEEQIKQQQEKLLRDAEQRRKEALHKALAEDAKRRQMAKEGNKYHEQNYTTLQQKEEKYSQQMAEYSKVNAESIKKAEEDYQKRIEQHRHMDKEMRKKAEENIEKLYQLQSRTKEQQLVYQENQKKILAENAKKAANYQKQQKEQAEKGKKLGILNIKLLKAKQDKIRNFTKELLAQSEAVRKQNLRKLDEQQQKIIEERKRQEQINNERLKKLNKRNEKYKGQSKVYAKKAEERRELARKKMEQYMAKLKEQNSQAQKRYAEFAKKLEETRKEYKEYNQALSIAQKQRIKENTQVEYYKGEEVKSKSPLADKYPQGVSEEVIDEGNRIILKRYRVEGDHVDVYEQISYKWGATYYTKNGRYITKAIWDIETKGKK